MILITGSSGFVGRNLVSELMKTKHKLCCVLRESTDKKYIDYLEKNNVAVTFCSLSDYESLYKSVKKFKISSIIHLAGIIKSSKVEDYRNTNVIPALNLIKICKIKNIKQFIFVSTDLALMTKFSNYGKSKKDAELAITKSHLRYVILRPTVIYGKGDNKFIMDIVRIIRKYPIIIIPGDGEYTFQPVFIDDIVNILIKSLSIQSNKIFNVCTDDLLTMNELVDNIAKILNKKIYKIHLPLWLLYPIIRIYESIFSNPIITTHQLQYFPLRRRLDNSLIKKDLNFDFTTFNDGITKSL